MGNIWTAIALGAGILLASSTTQRLDDTAVAAAIRAGVMKHYDHLISTCTAKPGFGDHMKGGMAGGLQPIGGYDVTVSAAPGRIAIIAAEGKRVYQPIQVADVPDAIREGDLLYVSAVPRSPQRSNKSYDFSPPIERVILRAKADGAIAQPVSVDLIPVEWTNLLGGSIKGASAVATFRLAAVKELPAGDIDVILVTQAGERRCKIGRGDRLKILGQ